jgi:hypothetical protein
MFAVYASFCGYVYCLIWVILIGLCIFHWYFLSILCLIFIWEMMSYVSHIFKLGSKLGNFWYLYRPNKLYIIVWNLFKTLLLMRVRISGSALMRKVRQILLLVIVAYQSFCVTVLNRRRYVGSVWCEGAQQCMQCSSMNKNCCSSSLLLMFLQSIFTARGPGINKLGSG